MFHYLMHSFWPPFGPKPEGPAVNPLHGEELPANEGGEFLDDALREEDRQRDYTELNQERDELL
ncbi:hypothetical protein [Paraflavitalea pollutisoli]|uniref:hypothetical protein n=1 Tax=Paraflavitalea pollutisoli TaxID=3034143 RepID=UPI0023ED6F55|nr:hypothetical protein [Paraflavitalea sp. H1-2-19X]